MARCRLASATIGFLGPKKGSRAPPFMLPQVDEETSKIKLPEIVYMKNFYKKYPESLYRDAVRTSSTDPTPARVFASRVLELKEQGIVSEEHAIAIADMEYRNEKKARKAAYKQLKQIACLQGKKPPPNPYPRVIKEMQDEEEKFVKARSFKPRIFDMVRMLKEGVDLKR